MAAMFQEIITSLKHLPPSRLAIVLCSPIIGLVTGYFLGASQTRLARIDAPSDVKKNQNAFLDESDEEEEDREEISGLMSSSEECKLVLVVRTDLGMTKGKIAAQCSHATLACYKSLLRAQPDIIKRWEQRGQAKVAVQVQNEQDLDLLQAQAMSLGICAKVIHDAGRTQISAGSATVLGVGPAEKSRVDQVTGTLKLL